MIDRKYFEPNPTIYFRDLLIVQVLFIASFAWAASVTGWIVLIPWVIAAVSLHRAGMFLHEIVHRPNHKRMHAFNTYWNWTTGALIMVPTLRFQKPHLTHHANGIFRTKNDPQYLLVRSTPGLMVLVLVVVPLTMPFLNFFQMLTAALGGIGLEEAIERRAQARGYSICTPMTTREKAVVTRLSRFYLAVFIVYAALLPQTLPLYYSLLAAGWFLTAARIPLEHELDRYADSSNAGDQILDSFTVETPLALLTQPLGFRFHTAHHMYPGVPYHNLPSLHAELKRDNATYRGSIIPLWAAIRGPKAQTRPDPANR
ncbi:MAG: fatty acid desaturase [Rhodospirillum sp.]|nr:fatty acid desaturase [Rhodospirillum sp.]MCF8490619.1 fatty acid desaturase [Rhodospirillum sp.]MCF8498934.1 fatty acid desaturase [Rhodospirillum sp.]